MVSSNPEISIIVPVYNVERYLRECLDSIKSQTFTNWECIMVDDGSPDNSAAIIDEYVKRDSRFKAIHRENGGLSAARNSGLEVARGKYIGFIDADDWVEPELYEELHRLIKQYKADMSQVGYYKEYKGLVHKKSLVADVTTYNHGELIREVFYDKSLPSYMWNKLFRREVISEPFPVGKVFEDIYTLSHWIGNINTGVFSPRLLYHYRFRKSSIVNTSSISYRLQYFESCLERARHLANQGLETIGVDERNTVLWRSAMFCAKIISRIVTQPKAKRLEALVELKELCDKNLSVPDKATLGRMKYKSILLFCNNPNAYINFVNFTHKFDLHSKYRTGNAYD